MITLIQNGELYSPDFLGKKDLLCLEDKISKIGSIDQSIHQLNLPIEFIDATDCYLFPGFIDPHEHLIGGSGEKGFESKTPEITLNELIEAGITTVVGCLGVDTISLSPATLLAKVKGLNISGLTAFMYSGGYNVPPVTLTDSIQKDILLINEVIGIGEIAIADCRSSQPTFQQLLSLMSESYVAGILSGKSGVCHIHVGDGNERLQLLREILDTNLISASLIYPTHLERSEALMLEGIDLTQRGVTIDLDTVDEDLVKWIKFYIENNGDLKKITVSSDAGIPSPSNLFNQIRECFFELKIPLEKLIPLVTQNSAAVLKLKNKGKISEGYDADIIVVGKKDFELKFVVSKGKTLFREGEVTIPDIALAESNRKIVRYGQKTKNEKNK